MHNILSPLFRLFITQRFILKWKKRQLSKTVESAKKPALETDDESTQNETFRGDDYIQNVSKSETDCSPKQNYHLIRDKMTA